MTINSKSKGNRAERQLAKIFSKKLGGSFVRTPSSGSFIGGKNSHRKTQLSETQIRATKSDIIPPDEYSKLVIEVKSYKELPYSNPFLGIPIYLLETWLKELEFDCDKDDIGVLCFKTNHKSWCISLHIKYLHHFTLDYYVVHNNYFITSLEKFLDSNLDQFKKIIG